MAVIHGIELRSSNFQEDKCILRIKTSSTPGILNVEVEEMLNPVSSYTFFEATTDQLKELVADLTKLINLAEQDLF